MILQDEGMKYNPLEKEEPDITLDCQVFLKIGIDILRQRWYSNTAVGDKLFV